MDAEIITDDLLESTKRIAAADAYREAYKLFFEVKKHIEELMKEGVNK